MQKSYTIGIDVGTSGCKTIIIDELGRVVASVIEEYPLYTPNPGWAEQEPEDWWKAAVEGIKKILPKSGVDKSLIKGIGLSAQMHGLVVLDNKNRVLRRAFLWNDQRTIKQCNEILDIVGGEKELLKYTNNNMLPGYTGGKILWLRENEPEIYEKSKIFLNPKDYIRFKLTGEFATEVSDASGMGLFNVEHRCWNDKLLAILDIPKNHLPRCFESIEVTGRLLNSVSDETGLPKNTPVVGGGGDSVIQTTGTGLVDEGILGTTIGTGGILAMALNKFRFNKTGKVQVFCNNMPNKWHVMGVALCAGGSFNWYRKNLCQYQSFEAENKGVNIYKILNDEVASSTPGSKNLIYLPYLIGERCPYPDPNARGTFVGLTLRHSHADMTRAVQEGVIYSLRQIYELVREMDSNIGASEIRTSGGGSLSPQWRQIQADIFQLPVKIVSGSSEGGAYGAALVAGVGCGVWESVEAASELLEVQEETLPNPANKERYDQLFQVYKGLYPALKGSFDQLAAIK